VVAGRRPLCCVSPGVPGFVHQPYGQKGVDCQRDHRRQSFQFSAYERFNRQRSYGCSPFGFASACGSHQVGAGVDLNRSELKEVLGHASADQCDAFYQQPFGLALGRFTRIGECNQLIPLA